MVKVIIGNITSKIVGYLPDEINIKLDNTLSYKLDGAEHIKLVKEHKWDGIIRLYHQNKGQSFYTGLLSLVTDILKENKIEHKVEDSRVVPEQNLPHLMFSPPPNYTEREYQQFAISKSVARTRGILKMATGAGKTLTICELIGNLKTGPFMFYVLTKDLMEQAYDSLSMTLNEPIGIIGGGKYDVKNINVCTIQTAVQALNSNNKNFKISDYLFDDEDDKSSWDESQMLARDKSLEIQRLVTQTKGLYFDECITGNSKIVTEFGEVTVAEAIENNHKYVLTLNCNRDVFSLDDFEGTTFCKILNKWKKGKKETIKIETEDEEFIICTKDHKIYTKNGWVNAINLSLDDKVICLDKKDNSLTIWKNIKTISRNEIQNVYDIEVENTHCFFANGILVHNCHHSSARTVKDILTASVNAYWRFGGSATPQRDDNAEIMIQAMFGKKIVDISASYLIKNKYLVKPYIFFVPVEDSSQFHTYAKIYNTCIVKNDEFNQHVISIAKNLVDNGLSTLILVQQFNHGDYIKKYIDGSVFMTSRMSGLERKETLQKVRNREIMTLLGSSLADEGLNISSLNSAILAGGGASSTRIFQRIGRTLRLDKNNPKDKSIVVIFAHDAKYLSKHAKKVKTLLKTEEEFVIINSKGLNFINDEINSLLNNKSSSDIFHT